MKGQIIMKKKILCTAIAAMTVLGACFGGYEALNANKSTKVEAAEKFSDWNANTIYNTGDVVKYNGSYWEAGWYTQGMIPGTTGEWGVWKPYQGQTPSNPSNPTAKPTNNPNPTAKPTYNPYPTAKPSNPSQGASGSAYMDKIQVVNRCPADANTKKSNVRYGSFTKKSYYSTTTRTNRNVNVLLPANYDKNKKYPVCYVLHGIFGNEDSMIDGSNGLATISANLASEGRAKEMIIVCPNIFAPSNPNVQQGYTDECFDGYNNFINDIAKDLMPWMEKNYSVATGRENTAICGFSMGGRTALYIGYARSDLFGYVAGFCPAPGIFAARDAMAVHKGIMQESEFRASQPHYVSMIVAGTNDGVVGTFPKQYSDVLKRNSQSHLYIEVPGAGHDSQAVSCGFYNFATGLFGALN